MLSKLSYNHMKLVRFFASIFLLLVYALEIFAKEYLPKTLVNILVIIALLLYIASIMLFLSQRNAKKVVMDELSQQNETKAAQFTYLMLTIAIFGGILFTKLTDENVSLSYDVLFCVLIAVSAVNDGYYLYLEQKGYSNAAADDED